MKTPGSQNEPQVQKHCVFEMYRLQSKKGLVASLPEMERVRGKCQEMRQEKNIGPRSCRAYDSCRHLGFFSKFLRKSLESKVGYNLFYSCFFKIGNNAKLSEKLQVFESFQSQEITNDTPLLSNRQTPLKFRQLSPQCLLQ